MSEARRHVGGISANPLCSQAQVDPLLFGGVTIHGAA
jgi:hypothetical protein